MDGADTFCVHGGVVVAGRWGEVDILKDRTVLVRGGKIVAIVENSNPSLNSVEEHIEQAMRGHGFGCDVPILRLKGGEFMVPGFIDLHVHAPQYSYAGTATDCPLMEWLDKYTFPRESGQDAPELSGTTEAENEALIRRVISTGTTTALYFGTLRLQSTLRFAHQLHEAGQRAFVGKVAMDRMSPEIYTASTQDNIADTEAFIHQIRSLEGDLIEPVITPRFVPTCSPELLAGLGKLAAKHRVLVQSHISESLDEVAFCNSLHPEADGRDAPLFDAAKLLTDRCVMAHGVCLTDEELGLLAQRGTALAHCPLSNFYFADVLLRVQKCRALGVKVGLGTDVAGGYSYSMLDSIRQAVIASKALRMQEIARAGGAPPPGVDDHLLNWKQAFYLATIGGAAALGIQDKVGSLEAGKDFDCLIVDGGRYHPPGVASSAESLPFDVFRNDTPLDVFEKFINLGDDRNVKAVYVKGRRIK